VSRPKRNDVLALLLASVLAVDSPRCGPLDLATAQALAIARSDEVAIQKAQVLTAQTDVAVATSIAFVPEFALLFLTGVVPGAHLLPGASPNDVTAIQSGSNRGLTQLGFFGRMEVNLLQPVYTFGRISAAQDAARAGLSAQELLVQDKVNAVRQQTLQLVLAATLTRRLLVIVHDVETALKDVDKRMAQSLKDNDGEVSSEDRYRLELFKSELLQRKADAERAQTLARAALSTLLVLPEPDLHLKEDPFPDPGEVALPDISLARQEAEKDRPDIRALDKAIEAKRAEVHATWAEQLPQFFLAGQFAYSRSPGRDTITNPYIGDYFNALTIGALVGFRQNLSFFTLKAKEDKVEAELRALERQREAASHGVDLQVEQAHADLVAALAKRKAAQSALAAGRSWFRSAGLNFAVGVGDARSVVDAYTGYAKSQLDDAQSTYDLLVAQGRLNQVLGVGNPPGPQPCVP
jgi:outer membrane protein, multidrug efflux system